MTRFDSARVRLLREGKKVKTPTSYGGLVDEGSFDFTIDYDVERPKRGALIV